MRRLSMRQLSQKVRCLLEPNSKHTVPDSRFLYEHSNICLANMLTWVHFTRMGKHF